MLVLKTTAEGSRTNDSARHILDLGRAKCIVYLAAAAAAAAVVVVVPAHGFLEEEYHRRPVKVAKEKSTKD